jgi:hypothetical protein
MYNAGSARCVSVVIVRVFAKRNLAENARDPAVPVGVNAYVT